MKQLAKYLSIASSLFLSVSVAFAETVTRLENETIEAFAERVTPPNAVLAHKIIESVVWGNNKKSVFIFFSENPDSVDREVVGYVYIPIDTYAYRRILIGHYRFWYNTKIESVFFGNADKDTEKVLGIIVSGDYYISNVAGVAYSTYIYRAPSSTSTKLENIEEVTKEFGFQCDCHSPNGTVKAKYKTAADVKKKLKKFGM